MGNFKNKNKRGNEKIMNIMKLNFLTLKKIVFYNKTEKQTRRAFHNEGCSHFISLHFSQSNHSSVSNICSVVKSIFNLCKEKLIKSNNPYVHFLEK